jgi:hypothetical protein
VGSWFSIDSFRIYFDVTPDLLVRRYVFRARARNLNELFQNRSWRSCTNAVTLNYRKGAVADGENSDLYGAFLCALTFSSLLLLGIKMSTTPWHVRYSFPPCHYRTPFLNTMVFRAIRHGLVIVLRSLLATGRWVR